MRLNIEHDATQEYSVKNQYFATSIVFTLIVAFGVFTGWSSSSTILLTSDESPMRTGKMSMDEVSWAVALAPAGACFASLFIGYITKNFGRKKPMLLNTIPMIIGWLLILFAQNPIYLFVSRFLGGFSGTIAYMIALIFQSEIANDRIRGALVTAVAVAESVGNLLIFIIGSFSYDAQSIFPIVLIVITSVPLYYLPETPLYLAKQNKLIEAENSIRFYKNIPETHENCDKLLKLEIKKLKTIIADDQITNDSDGPVECSDFTTKVARKTFVIGMVLVGLYMWTGAYSMSAYIENVFQQTGSSLSLNMSTIVVGIIQLIGTLTASATVDRFGRKPLIAVSGIGVTIGLAVMGIYMMLKSWNISVEVMNWVPLVFFSWISLISSIGIQSLPMSIIPEILPERIKEAGIGFFMTFVWISAFINMKYSLHLIEAIGFHWNAFISAGICTFCTLFILIFMPETKGKSHEEIMKLFE